MSEPDTRAQPPRLPGDLIVRLVEAHHRGSARSLPMCHAADVLPLLEGDDRQYAAAAQLLDAGKVFYPNANEQ